MEQLSSGRGGSRRPKLLFVCRVNRCRSPLAGVWAVRKCSWPQNFVRTAGLQATEGLLAHPTCSRFLLTHGLSIEHISRQLRAEDCAWSDKILCVSEEHRGFVARCFPEFGHKTLNLAALLGKSALEDPVEEAKNGAEAAELMTQVCIATEHACASLSRSRAT